MQRGRRRGRRGRCRGRRRRRRDRCGRVARLGHQGVGPEEDHSQARDGGQRDYGSSFAHPRLPPLGYGQASQPGRAARCGRRGNASSGAEWRLAACADGADRRAWVIGNDHRWLARPQHAVGPLRSSGRGGGERPPGGRRARRQLTRQTCLHPARSDRNRNAEKPLHAAPPLRRASSSRRLALGAHRAFYTAHFTQRTLHGAFYTAHFTLAPAASNSSVARRFPGGRAPDRRCPQASAGTAVISAPRELKRWAMAACPRSIG